MKKVFIFLLVFLSIIGTAFSFEKPKANLSNRILVSFYDRLELNINSRYYSTIEKMDSYEIGSLSFYYSNIKIDLEKLDLAVKNKDRNEGEKIFQNLKIHLRELYNFLRAQKEQYQNIIVSNANTIGDTQNNEEISNNHNQIEYSDLTFYADYFEGRYTSNGNIFSQKYYSAARCNIELNTLIQVGYEEKSVIVKVNDRPNCTKYPTVVDLSKSAAFELYPESKGRADGWHIILKKAPSNYYKQYIPVNLFEEQNVLINSKTPNSYLLNETLNISGEAIAPYSDIEFKIITPSGKTIFLTKNVYKYFTFSYPLEEEGKYDISINGSSPFGIYVLNKSLFEGKKLIKKDNKKIDAKFIKEYYSDTEYFYKAVFEENKYYTVKISNIEYSGVGNVVIPKDIFELNIDREIIIYEQEMFTNFSHDFYTDRLEIYKGGFKISE